LLNSKYSPKPFVCKLLKDD